MPIRAGWCCQGQTSLGAAGQQRGLPADAKGSDRVRLGLGLSAPVSVDEWLRNAEQDTIDPP